MGSCLIECVHWHCRQNDIIMLFDANQIDSVEREIEEFLNSVGERDVDVST